MDRTYVYVDFPIFGKICANCNKNVWLEKVWRVENDLESVIICKDCAPDEEMALSIF